MKWAIQSVIRQSFQSTSSILLCAFLVAGCTEESGVGIESTDSSTAGKLFISTPGFLNARALNPDELRVNVQVDGTEVAATRVGDAWTVTIQVAPDTPYILTIEWTNSSGLLLAQYDQRQAAVTTNSSLSITSDQYQSSGNERFDTDDDGSSNLAEIDAGTDPNDPDSKPGSVVPDPVTVSLPRVQVSEAPLIDGLYDDVWDQAQFSDTDANRLFIDNLLSNVDTNTQRTDGNAEFLWAGMHDGTHLYLYIFGENRDAQGADARADSTILYHDDSVELFFDGNLSRGTSYDGVDDTSIIIALLDQEGNSSGRISRGASGSQPIPEGLRFFNCLCSPVYTWEIAIPLTSLNINPEQPFGMELQLNDDNTGGDRDSYWGWFQTSRSPATFFEPRVMGTIELR
ncbi:MAG: sugar-binding protein [Granulosicoccus sp.]